MYSQVSPGKGEIALKEQFLLFHSGFKRLVLQTLYNQDLFGNGLSFYLPFPVLPRFWLFIDCYENRQFAFLRKRTGFFLFEILNGVTM